jgi:hypothetical protein
MKDSVLTGTVEGAITNVTEVLAQLTTYNITQEAMDLWSDALDSFKDIVSNPKVAHDGVDVLRNRIQESTKADTIGEAYETKNFGNYTYGCSVVTCAGRAE